MEFQMGKNSFDENVSSVKDNRDLLLAMMDAMPLCLNVWDRNFHIQSCNHEFLRLLQIDSLEEMQANFFQYAPTIQPDGEPSVKKAQKLLTQAFKEGTATSQWLHCLKTGEEIPAEVHFVRIHYLDDFVVVSYTWDLRGQQALQKQTEKFNSRLHSILNATPLCLNLWDRHFQNAMCNKEAVELFALESAERYTQEFSRLSPEFQPDGKHSDEAAVEMIQRAFDTGRCEFFWMHRKLDGELIPSEITLVKIDGLDDDGGDMVAGFTRDLRLQLAAERIERTASQRIGAVLEAMPLACLLWSLEGKIFECNRAAVTMFGAKDTNEVIQNFDEFLPDRQPDGQQSVIKKEAKFKEVRTKGACTFEWVYQNRQKEEVPCAVTLVLVHTEEESMIVAYSQDLRELQQTLELNKRLQKMAYYDWLTGSVSRAYFMETCTNVFQTLKEGDLFTLLILDFDNFKGLNDTYGHEMGDIVLKEVIKSVMNILPQSASLGRYGGDEFLIQTVGLSRTEMEALIHAILTCARKMPFSRDGKIVTTTLSIGGAFWKSFDTTFQKLLNRADQALYKAKQKGRNCGIIL